MRTLLLALAAGAVSACQPGPVAAPAGGLPGLSVVPAPGGLSVAGSGGREIGFGRDQIGALASVTRIEGTPPRPFECGTGREAFITDGNILLVFERAKFVGWGTVEDSAGRGCG